MNFAGAFLDGLQALAILLLSLNAHDYYYASQYMVWSRIISFVFAVVLFFAAICLLGGLNRVRKFVPYISSNYLTVVPINFRIFHIELSAAP